MINHQDTSTYRLARLECRMRHLLAAPLPPRVLATLEAILWDIRTEMVTRRPLERKLARFWAQVVRGGRW